MKRLLSIVLSLTALFFLIEAGLPRIIVTFYPVYKEIASNYMVESLDDYNIYSTAHLMIWILIWHTGGP
ncbi:MAG: hypothetical protein QME46_00355 [Thermoanaerobacteraceae bacterium]|nr:hypothetical protein [Thermoanaerobacteraceae bacterium]